MSERDDFSRGYIKGFREGLFDAWNELVKLANRGYAPRELKIMLTNSRSALNEKVDHKKTDIERALGRRIFSEEKEITPGLSASDLSPGMSICFKEERPKNGIELLKKFADDGLELLSISRKHPQEFRELLGIEKEMIWLTKSESNGLEDGRIRFISPTNLPIIAETIREFLDGTTEGVIFLEGLEYLFTQNDFNSVLRFIQLINEQVLLKKGYLILSVNPTTMDPREFSLVEREMSQVA